MKNMQIELIIKSIYEYKEIGVISVNKEIVKTVLNKEQIKWFKTFKQLLSKGIWSKQIAKILGIPKVIECENNDSVTLIIQYIHKTYDKKFDKYVTKINHYMFDYDKKCCRLYLNTSLISELKHPLEVI